MNQKFSDIYKESIEKPEIFWKKISEDIFWYKKPSKILNKSNPPFYKWYEDGVTNTCYNAVDIHVEKGLGEKTALIYDSPITGSKRKITYLELKNLTAKSSPFLVLLKVRTGPFKIFDSEVFRKRIGDIFVAAYKTYHKKTFRYLFTYEMVPKV